MRRQSSRRPAPPGVLPASTQLSSPTRYPPCASGRPAWCAPQQTLPAAAAGVQPTGQHPPGLCSCPVPAPGPWGTRWALRTPAPQTPPWPAAGRPGGSRAGQGTGGEVVGRVQRGDTAEEPTSERQHGGGRPPACRALHQSPNVSLVPPRARTPPGGAPAALAVKRAAAERGTETSCPRIEPAPSSPRPGCNRWRGWAAPRPGAPCTAPPARLLQPPPSRCADLCPILLQAGWIAGRAVDSTLQPNWKAALPDRAPLSSIRPFARSAAALIARPCVSPPQALAAPCN